MASSRRRTLRQWSESCTVRAHCDERGVDNANVAQRWVLGSREPVHWYNDTDTRSNNTGIRPESDHLSADTCVSSVSFLLHYLLISCPNSLAILRTREVKNNKTSIWLMQLHYPLRTAVHCLTAFLLLAGIELETRKQIQRLSYRVCEAKSMPLLAYMCMTVWSEPELKA